MLEILKQGLVAVTIPINTLMKRKIFVDFKKIPIIIKHSKLGEVRIAFKI